MTFKELQIRITYTIMGRNGVGIPRIRFVF